MSIATHLNKLKTDLEAAYAALEAKGATMPDDCNYENLADTIASISGGGFGKPSKLVNSCSNKQVLSSTKGILLFNTYSRSGLMCAVKFEGAGGKIVGLIDYSSSSPTDMDSSTTVRTYTAGTTVECSMSGFVIPDNGGTVKVTAPSTNYVDYHAIIW